MEILMGVKQTPAELFARLPKGVSTPEIRVDVAEGVQHELMKQIMASEQFSDGKVRKIDGLRVDYPTCWGLVRASNTTSSLTLRFEGDDAAALDEIQGKFRTVLLAVDGSLMLPF